LPPATWRIPRVLDERGPRPLWSLDVGAIFFDLDETLVQERPTAESVIRALCLETLQRHRVDADPLKDAVFAEARRLWYAFEAHPFCKRIGISSWEGLWCRFEGPGPEFQRLRDWAPAYRRDAWTNALAVHGVDDPDLGAELAERYPAERRKVHRVFPDVLPALETLIPDFRLAIVTNGDSGLQREKLAGAGLTSYFDAVVVSGDVGVRKPDPAPFRQALALTRCAPNETIVVGDGLESDVLGAQRAGMCGIWINRPGKENDTDVVPAGEIGSLLEITPFL